MRSVTPIVGLFLVFILQLAIGCKQSPASDRMAADSTVTKGRIDTGFTKDTLLNESFKTSRETRKATGNLKFNSGTWYLEEASLATGNPYESSDDQAVRVHSKGRLGMRFDIIPRGRLLFYVTTSVTGENKLHAWGLFISEDKGNSYKRVYVVKDTARFERKVFMLADKPTVPLRFELRKLSEGKNEINFDDIVICSVKDKN